MKEQDSKRWSEKSKEKKKKEASRLPPHLAGTVQRRARRGTMKTNILFKSSG